MGLYVSRRGPGISFGLLGALFAAIPVLMYYMLKLFVLLFVWMIHFWVWLAVAIAAMTGRTTRRPAKFARPAPARNQPGRHAVAPYQFTPIPAGWYPAQSDPTGSVRYWDGQRWTQGFKP